MKIGITGPNGYVGSALVKAGAIPLNCDVTDFVQVEDEIERVRPDIVFHLAAVTNLNECEDDEYFTNAYNVNVRGVHNVGSALARRKLPGMYISSYHIWAGGLNEKHKEVSKITPAKNRYGMMKLAGEVVAHETGMKTVRTSYIFNRARLKSKLEDLKNGYTINEPIFMYRSFIHLSHFVIYLNMYAEAFDKMPTILHIAGSKNVSWYKFMRTAAEYLGYNKDLVKMKMVDDRNEVPRPWNGGLDVSLLMSFGFSPVDYFDGIKKMFHED